MTESIAGMTEGTSFRRPLFRHSGVFSRNPVFRLPPAAYPLDSRVRGNDGGKERE